MMPAPSSRPSLAHCSATCVACCPLTPGAAVPKFCRPSTLTLQEMVQESPWGKPIGSSKSSALEVSAAEGQAQSAQVPATSWTRVSPTDVSRQRCHLLGSRHLRSKRPVWLPPRTTPSTARMRCGHAGKASLRHSTLSFLPARFGGAAPGLEAKAILLTSALVQSSGVGNATRGGTRIACSSCLISVTSFPNQK